MGRKVEIQQKLKERAEIAERMNTKTNSDEPAGVAVGPDGTIVIAMKSGRVWSCHRAPANRWAAVGWGPLPDSVAREEFDEYLEVGRELKKLGYVEED